MLQWGRIHADAEGSSLQTHCLQAGIHGFNGAASMRMRRELIPHSPDHRQT